MRIRYFKQYKFTAILDANCRRQKAHKAKLVANIMLL